MQIKLEELRNLIKKTLSETYFGGTSMGGLASTALNKVGTVPGGSSVDLPPDPVEIAKQLRALIGKDAGYPVGVWGDVALNAAAEAAADALINTEHRDKTRRSPDSLGEQKKYLKEVRDIIKEVESQATVDPAALESALNKIIKILDSMDMSLDLVYGALSGYEGPISGIRTRQRAFGRAMGAQTADQSSGVSDEG
tara:strand:- start:987 stop:1574 length:588 start_codon:yes stop_codon:yes gene_type:complete